MRVVAIAARTVRWPIASQGAARGRTERAAVVLELRSAQGAIGLGEAAPLAGMSVDTLEDTERAIAAFARHVPFEVTSLAEPVPRALTPDRVDALDPCMAFELADPETAHAFAASPPAARFAIETALLDALARERGVSVSALLEPLLAHMHSRSELGAASPRTIEDAHVGAGHAAHRAPAPDPDNAPSPIAPEDAHVGAGHAAHRARSSGPDNAPSPIATEDPHVGDRTTPRPPSPDTDNAASPGAPEDPHVGDVWYAQRSSGSTERVIPLAAVVDDPREARQAFVAGIRCLKIKLVASDDPDRVLAIAAAAPGARLRIDANRTWPRAEVADRLAVLAQLPIDYVEEPCPDAHRLLSEPLPCKLALDESLLQMTSDEIHAALRSPQLAAIVLKPTLLGGFSVVLPLAVLARRHGVAAIISHTLEGPIGTAACAELALALDGGPSADTGHPHRAAAHDAGGHPVGLAAHAALDGWLIQVPQLAADHVHRATAPGLGFVDLDLAGAGHA